MLSGYWCPSFFLYAFIVPSSTIINSNIRFYFNGKGLNRKSKLHYNDNQVVISDRKISRRCPNYGKQIIDLRDLTPPGLETSKCLDHEDKIPH
jgi:hypothetical protein